MSLGFSFQGVARVGRDSAAWDDCLKRLGGQYQCQVHETGPDSYALVFCPDGALHVTLEGEKAVEGEATTTPAGPGFHKAAIELLDAIARECGLSLTVEDETGYWAHRNFTALQHEHETWLKAVFSLVARQDETAHLISWPTEQWKPVFQVGAATPVGLFNSTELQAMLDQGRLAERFFTWYNEDRDALFHRAIALHLLWNECCWVEPRTDQEERLLASILGRLAHARQLDPSLPMPMGAWTEVALLAGKPQGPLAGPDLEPGKQVGYRRLPLQHQWGSWQVTLPGHFLVEHEENTLVGWDRGITFRLSAYRTQSPPAPLEGTPVLTTRAGNWHYQAVRAYSQEEECWLLHGQIYGHNRLAVVTVAVDEESQLNWAAGLFRSVSNREP